MKPVIKYQGGKSKELPLIKQMLPRDYNRVVEPFCGGAAVSFGLKTPAILNDINPMVINLYKILMLEGDAVLAAGLLDLIASMDLSEVDDRNCA